MTKHTILYIDDNQANRQLIELILAQKPEFQYLQAENGAAGLQQAKISFPDLILLDLTLPDMDGVEILHLLANDPATQFIPVIILSGNIFNRADHPNIPDNFFTSMNKPVDITTLYDNINKALQII